MDTRRVRMAALTVLLLTTAWILAGCPATATPTPVLRPQETPTATPTNVPVPTATPTPAPTETPTTSPPTASPTPPVDVTPTPERVTFAPGTTSITLTGQIAWPQLKSYILRALAGQTMTVEILSPDGLANFSIVGADGSPYKRLVNEDRAFSFVLPVTQDYRITVARPHGTSTYTLTISITSPSPDVERIVFAPGEIRARRSGVLEPGERKEFLLTAAAGQVMEVVVSSDPVPVDLDVISPDGVHWFGRPLGPDGTSSVSTFALPAQGEYRIVLEAPLAAPAIDYELIVTVVTPARPGMPPERVTFAPGTVSAILQGGLLPGIEKRYVLGARAGQLMRVRVTSLWTPVELTLVAPGGATFPGEALGSEVYIVERSLTLPEDGDYTVVLGIPSGAEPTLYEVLFEIVDPAGVAPTPTPERVTFAPGTTSITLTGQIAWPQLKSYVLRALAGQTMTVEILSPDGLANFSIVGADGSPYKRLVNEDRSFSFVLPATQDYRITVARPHGTSTYTLTISIE